MGGGGNNGRGSYRVIAVADVKAVCRAFRLGYAAAASRGGDPVPCDPPNSSADRGEPIRVVVPGAAPRRVDPRRPVDGAARLDRTGC